MTQVISMPLPSKNSSLASEINEKYNISFSYLSRSKTKSPTSSDLSKSKVQKSRRISRARLRDKLPENYHQKIVESENEFMKFESFDTVVDLINLYKVGVEYYSDKNFELQQDYMDKMHLFLSSKNVLKLIKIKLDPKIQPSSLSRHTFSTDSLKNFKKRQSTIVSLELNKINFRNCSNDYNKNIGDTIRKFELNFVTGCRKFDHGINSQKTQFLEKLKIKKFKLFLKSDSKVYERNHTFMRRRSRDNTIKSAMLPDKRKAFRTISYKKKLNFNNYDGNEKENKECENTQLTTTPINKFTYLDNSKIISKKINKHKKKHIGNMIENYITNLQVKFLHKFCEPEVKKIISELQINFYKKTDNFLDYYDSRAEIEIMLLDNPNWTSKRLYNQLIDSMRIDYEKFLIEINQSENNLISQIVKQACKNKLSDDFQINELSEELIVNLINVFK